MLTFNKGRLKSTLLTLSRQKQLAFALLIVERMLPGLLRFSNEENFNPSIFISTRDEVWNVFSENRIDDPGSLTSSDELRRATPHSEDFSNPFVSQALDTALAIDSIIEFLGNGRVDHIVEIASLARDSVYLYLSVLEASLVTTIEIHEQRSVHSLMQQELQRQADDLKFISELPKDLDDQSTDLLRLRAKNQPDLLQD